MKKYLSYIAEPDVRKKDASLDYYLVDYFNETPQAITLRLVSNKSKSLDFDYLAEDLFAFSQMSKKMKITAFARDGHYRFINIVYTI